LSRPTARHVAAILLIAAVSQGGTNPPSARPQPVPPAVAKGLSLQPIARGLQAPVDVVTPPGDPRKRLFVVEKGGTIRILSNGKAMDPPFLDLRERVSRGGEQGLLGLAFHPAYARNGRLVVNYTDRQGDTHVTAFRVDPKRPDRVDPASAKDLFTVDQPYANHNGGHLAFGPDGRLYVGMGDGGSGNDPHGHGQNPRSRLGKMLRLDVDRAGAAPAIIQTGLRNPWRFTFDRRTGDLYIADVGQHRWEEINVVPAQHLEGHNFGWAVVEGLGHCLKAPNCNQKGLTLPVLEYSHDDGCSITGGIIYRGRALPALNGHYFYSDFCRPFLRSFRWQGGAVRDSWEWTAALNPDGRLDQIAAFGEDADGEMLIVAMGGTIARLLPRR
jgi:glucose/arabinose dehydrogenase